MTTIKTDLEMIRDIREAKNNNKLVIFVGSGISANSDMPTWGTLISNFAKSLNYNHCDTCPDKNSEACHLDKCDRKYNFSQDEYLKIAEYCYLNNKSEYYRILTSTFRIEAKPNVLHSLIYKLQPHHIITTNFDSLLENTTEPFSRVFSVIKHDSDLFNSSSFQHYLIKMHGDIDDVIDEGSLDKIVLKEQEFVEYEQTHPLISTFIKSLLIDHTFLFLGYSVNDYNLKVILGWVNYYLRNLDAKISNDYPPRSKYYILSTEQNSYQNFIIKYYNNNNLYLLPIEHFQNIKLPKEADTLKEKGKDLCRVIESIRLENTDNQNFSALDVLFKRYQVLNAYNKISHEDFLSVSKFKSAEIIGKILVFFDQIEYNWAIKAISADNRKTRYIVSIFRKTGITQLKLEKHIWKLTDSATIQDVQIYNLPKRKKRSLEERLLNLYQNNQYVKIEEILESLTNSRIKQYYLALLNPYNPAFTYTYDIREITDNSEYNARTLTEVLFQKYNQFTISLFLLFINPGKIDYYQIQQIKAELLQIIDTLTPSQSQATKYLQGLIKEKSNQIDELENAWDEVKKAYTDSHHIVLESGEKLIQKMQTIVYDYYYYTSLNCLYTKHNTYCNKFYEQYIDAILSTYSPQKTKVKNNLLINYLPSYISSIVPEWKLTETDVDIIVKHSNLNKINELFKTYNISRITYSKNIHLATKFKNLCDAFKKPKFREYFIQFETMVGILIKSRLTSRERGTVINATIDLIKYYSDYNSGALITIIPAVNRLVYHFPSQHWSDLLICLINKKVISDTNLLPGDYDEFINLIYHLKKYTNEKIINKLNYFLSHVSKEKLARSIYLLHHIIDEKKWLLKIQKNYFQFTGRQLLDLLIKEKISFSDKIGEVFLTEIHNAVSKQDEDPHKHQIPNPIELSLNNYLILYILNKPVNLENIKGYIRYSSALEFLLNPENFDYSKVDIEYYMWQNILRSEKYRPYLKSHISEIITEKIKEKYKLHQLTVSNEELILKYLLDWDVETFYR